MIKRINCIRAVNLIALQATFALVSTTTLATSLVDISCLNSKASLNLNSQWSKYFDFLAKEEAARSPSLSTVTG